MLGGSEILGLTNYSTSPRKLTLYNSRSRQPITTLSVADPIMRSILHTTYIVIISLTQIYIYTHTRESIKPIGNFTTAPNPNGICEVGGSTCVFPARSTGQVHVVRLGEQQEVGRGVIGQRIVPAHTAELKALCLTKDEEIVCSASRTGTLLRLHSTSSGVGLGELRRGVGSAEIYGLAASPSGGQLAVTSNTNTLHIFNLPTSQSQIAKQSLSDKPSSPDRHSSSSMSSSPPSTSPSLLNWQKWTTLSKIPYAPRVFTDVYSFVSATFDPGSDEYPGIERSKGMIGWVSDETIVVLSSGRDARYERFELKMEEGEGASLKRVGWSRFMRPN